jgi:hypothetical protein
MKQGILAFSFLIISMLCYGQMHSIYYYDSLFRRPLQRYMVTRYCEACARTGLALIQISKVEDSLRLISVYSSDSNYNYTYDKIFTKEINSRCNQFVENGFRMLVPIYFYYEDDSTLHKPSSLMDSRVRKKIKDLSNNMVVMEPIIVTRYPSVR